MNSFEKILQAWSSLAKDHVKLFFLELKLAGLSLVSVIIFGVLILITTIGFWLLILALIAYSAWFFGLNIFLSLTVALVFNLIVTLTFATFLYRYAKNMTFKHTRQQLNNYITKRVNHENHKKITKRNRKH